MELVRKRCLSALLMAVSACQSNPEAERTVVRRDSAGVTIVENPQHQARARLAWIIDTVPELVIGGAEENEDLQLFRVTGAAQLTNGRIVVVNAGTQQIRFFDQMGAFLTSVGRRGDGPGEYQFPVLIRSARYDTLWIFDRGRRLTVLDDQGRLIRSIGPRSRLSQPVGVLAGKLVTAEGSARAGPETPEGMMSNDITYEMIDLTTETRDTIAQLAGFALFVWNIGGVFGFTRVPLDAAPSAGTGRDRLFVTGGEDAQVQVFDTLGILREIIRTGELPQPVPGAAFDQAVENELASSGDASATPELRRRYERMVPPDVLPVYQNLQVDSEGLIWLETFRLDNDQDPEWVVLHPSGNVLGRVAFPRSLNVLQIGQSFVLGLERDENDIERVVRYGLTRNQ